MFLLHVSSVGCSRKARLVESGSGTKLGVDPKEPSQQEDARSKQAKACHVWTGGPLPVRHGAITITPINGLKNGFACGYFTLLIGASFQLIWNWIRCTPPCTVLRRRWAHMTMDPVELHLLDFTPSPLFPGCTRMLFQGFNRMVFSDCFDEVVQQTSSVDIQFKHVCIR